MCNEPSKKNSIEQVKLLHSRYNPQAEADRYIASLSPDENIRFFILIEPGLGYITATLKKKFPSAKIIALHVENPDEEVLIEKPHVYWHFQAGMSIQDFLEREIPDSKAAGIRLLEWRPAMSLYGEAYLSLVKETTEFIKRADANARTFETFGPIWFRNFFKNLDIIKNILYLPQREAASLKHDAAATMSATMPAPFSSPVLVTGAGPGLEDAVPLIREKRDCLFILACSSSLPALTSGNIFPDLVISTDGTAWAKFHLYELFRIRQNFPLAEALTAALPSQCQSVSVLPICDGSLWQTLILSELKIPFITLPPRGTVSASALDLAFALSRAEVFLAGIDLTNSDIRSHARPYSLDRFMEEKAGRKNPTYSSVYKRSSLLKSGGAYGIYAAWFKKQLSSYPGPLYSIGKNSGVFSAASAASENRSEDIFKRLGARKARIAFQSFASKGSLSEAAYTILENALKNSPYREALKKELKPLGFLEKSDG